MKINGVDISQYGAKQWHVAMGYGNVTNTSVWNDGATSPLLLPGTVGMKKIKVTVIIKGGSRQEIWDRGNRIVSSLLSPAVVDLDGFTNHFKVVLNNPEHVEAAISRFHKVTLELIGYEYGNRVYLEFNNQNEYYQDGYYINELTINNKGTLTSPAIFAASYIDLKYVLISGLDRNRFTGEAKDIQINTISNVVNYIEIDGIDGNVRFVQGGEILPYQPYCVTLTGFPSLLPGENKIKCKAMQTLKGSRLYVRYEPHFI